MLLRTLTIILISVFLPMVSSAQIFSIYNCNDVGAHGFGTRQWTYNEAKFTNEVVSEYNIALAPVVSTGIGLDLKVNKFIYLNLEGQAKYMNRIISSNAFNPLSERIEDNMRLSAPSFSMNIGVKLTTPNIPVNIGASLGAEQFYNRVVTSRQGNTPIANGTINNFYGSNDSYRFFVNYRVNARHEFGIEYQEDAFNYINILGFDLFRLIFNTREYRVSYNYYIYSWEGRSKEKKNPK